MECGRKNDNNEYVRKNKMICGMLNSFQWTFTWAPINLFLLSLSPNTKEIVHVKKCQHKTPNVSSTMLMLSQFMSEPRSGYLLIRFVFITVHLGLEQKRIKHFERKNINKLCFRSIKLRSRRKFYSNFNIAILCGFCNLGMRKLLGQESV